MEQLKVFNLIEKKKDLFLPNDKYSDAEVEEALLNAPEGFEHTIESLKFFSPSTTEMLAKFTIGGDRLYLGDIKGGLLKIITFGGLFVWYKKEQINAKSRCRALNCEILFRNIPNN